MDAMSTNTPARPYLSWTVITPIVSLVLLAFTFGGDPGPVLVAVIAIALAGSVLAAVHHAEVVAHRVGEPLGSLVLAVAVTIIEVGLIVTLMVSGGEGTATLARDTVFAAVMITTNGIIGLSLFVASRRHHTANFNAEGSGAALGTVATLATLTMVVPSFTTSAPGPQFSPSQLAFAAVASLILYGAFVMTQTVRHRNFFLPVAVPAAPAPPATPRSRRAVRRAADNLPVDDEDEDDDDHDEVEAPSNKKAMLSLGLLLVALLAVVGLAKVESPAIEEGVAAIGFPQSFVGVVIALLVLLPETIAAVRAAGRNKVQISVNLAYGSAMASIGLTIPAIAIASIWLDGPLHLGLGSTQLVLLAMTVVVSVLTVVPGRATRLQGIVHLVLAAAFLFLAVTP
jgi:Ca2+:H+ antiporter